MLGHRVAEIVISPLTKLHRRPILNLKKIKFLFSIEKN